MVMATAAFTVLLITVSVGVLSYLYTHYDGQITREDVLNTKDPSIRGGTKQLNAANYLVIGSDSRAGTDGSFGHDMTSARSDTTMLAHLSPDRSRATVISIPRDSWLKIPACKRANGSVAPAHVGQFNSAFTDGGAACTIATVQALTGIAVTHYVQIDFQGFRRIVNALGSITICSPSPVNDVGSKLVLKAGNNKLNGTQALAYVRARESLGDGSDLGRIKRQQRFLGAILREARGGRLLRTPGAATHFLDAVTRAVVVDKGTSFPELKTLFDGLRGLDPKRVVFYTAPIADPAYNPDDPGQPGGRVLLDAAAGRVLYDSIIADQKKVVTPSGSAPSPSASPPAATRVTVAPGQITVAVTNAVGTPNLATNVQRELIGVGFGAGVLNLRRSGATTTTVLFAPTQVAAARTVAAALPGSVMRVDAAHAGDIEVVVGSGFHGVRSVRPGQGLPSWVKIRTAPTGSAPRSPAATPTGISAADASCAQ